MPSGKCMRSVARQSISEEFEMVVNSPIPTVQPGGARIQVYFAGACYTDQQVVKSGQRKPRLSGVQDTSLFPGYEVSGVVDEICPTVTNCNLKPGDRVIVYSGDDDEIAQSGYADYILVKDAANLIPIPDEMELDLAAQLPCGALTAYAAVEKARPFVEERLKNTTGIINVLIVGAGGLGLWTLKLAEYYIGTENSRVRIAVADSNVKKLEVAKRHGSTDEIHWSDSDYEEYLVMRTKNVCKGGVDVVIDFVSSARTIHRATTVVKEGGIIIVGGNSKQEVPICLHSLAMKNQSLIGIHTGTRQQLKDLVDMVASRKITPPMYTVFPVDEANQVFKRLSESKLDGRAVFRICVSGENDSVFFHDSDGSFKCIGGSADEIHDVSTPDSSKCGGLPYFRQHSEGTPVISSVPVTFSL